MCETQHLRLVSRLLGLSALRSWAELVIIVVVGDGKNTHGVCWHCVSLALLWELQEDLLVLLPPLRQP